MSISKNQFPKLKKKKESFVHLKRFLNILKTFTFQSLFCALLDLWKTRTKKQGRCLFLSTTISYTTKKICYCTQTKKGKIRGKRIWWRRWMEGRKEFFRGRWSERLTQNNRMFFAYAPDNYSNFYNVNLAHNSRMSR